MLNPHPTLSPPPMPKSKSTCSQLKGHKKGVEPGIYFNNSGFSFLACKNAGIKEQHVLLFIISLSFFFHPFPLSGTHNLLFCHNKGPLPHLHELKPEPNAFTKFVSFESSKALST